MEQVVPSINRPRHSLGNNCASQYHPHIIHSLPFTACRLTEGTILKFPLPPGGYKTLWVIYYCYQLCKSCRTTLTQTPSIESLRHIRFIADTICMFVYAYIHTYIMLIKIQMQRKNKKFQWEKKIKCILQQIITSVNINENINTKAKMTIYTM